MFLAIFMTKFVHCTGELPLMFCNSACDYFVLVGLICGYFDGFDNFFGRFISFIIFCCTQDALNYLIDVINYVHRSKAPVVVVLFLVLLPFCPMKPFHQISVLVDKISFIWILPIVTDSGSVGFSLLPLRNVDIFYMCSFRMV